MTRTIVGVDPGFSGAIAVLCDGAPKLYRMPLLKQRKHAYHVVEMAKILLGVNTLQGKTILELATAWHTTAENDGFDYYMPLLVVEQVTRPASLTRCMGLLEGLGEALGYEVVTVRPQEWKRYFGLGPVKADSIALALKTWPALKRFITKAGDDGLAEAALIALWAREVLG